MAKLVTFIEKEFILTQVIKNKSTVLVFGTGKCINACLKDFNKEELVIETTASEAESFLTWDKVSAFFSYQNQRITVPGRIKKIDKNCIIITLPEKVFKAPQRKSVRVQPPINFKLEFFLQNEMIRLDCPESNEYSNLELPGLSAGFDMASIASLLASFKRLSDESYSKNGIIMFNKKRKPEFIEERIIADFGRTLLIPSMQSGLPPKDPYPEGRIITQSMADKFEGPEIFTEGSQLERRKMEKSMSGIVSEIYCPILYYQYIVGYIYLMTDTKMKKCMDFRNVDYAWEFAHILAYVLKQNNYFKIDTEHKPDPYKPQVVDLSLSGCLLLMPKISFKKKVEQGTVLNMTMTDGKNSVNLKGRVVRRYDDIQNEYFGVSFIDTDNRALTMFQKLLYSRDDESFITDESSLEL